MPDGSLLFIHALTSLHPGSGTSPGVVDLPVQRERHTGGPLIPGSSLKGVLRSSCRTRLEDDVWTAIFGPETTNAADFAGALSLTDARLIAFPVRSLKGVFAWTTCPAALNRLRRDARLLADLDDVPAPPAVSDGEAACAGNDLVVGGAIVLEEFEYKRKRNDGDIAAWLAGRTFPDANDSTASRLSRNLVILSDNDFTYFVQHATEVVARVRLEYETKTVAPGALFYEEFLPPETLLYSVDIAGRSRNRDAPLEPAGVLQTLDASMPKVLQIGGNETTGKGLCAVRLSGQSTGGAR